MAAPVRRTARPCQPDEVAGLAVDASDAVLVTGTSWNGYVSIGGTATDIVTLKFAAGAAPALLAPSRLDATALSRSEIRLRWQDNAGTEDGFRIERCAGVGCTGFVQVAAVGRNATSYVDGVRPAARERGDVAALDRSQRRDRPRPGATIRAGRRGCAAG